MKYYIKDYGEETEDARELGIASIDVENFAEYAAQAFWTQSGWEACWPKIFTIIEDDGKETDVAIDVEMCPTFTASRIKS